MTGWFSRYRAEDHLAEPAECSVAWLTGQSSFTHSSLSPGQLSVLDDMSGLGYRAVSCGFPYNTAALSQPYRKEHVIAASVRNGAQFIAARISRRFVGDLAQHVQPLFDTTSRRLLLLCGSCGVELLSAVLPVVRGGEGLRVLVVALGPVGRLPRGRGIEVRVVRGRRDWISRVTSRGAAHYVAPGGHLDYVDDPRVRAEVVGAARGFLL